MGFYLNKIFHFVLVGNLDKGKMTKEESAQEYLQSHKIVELLNNMTTMLVFNRPEDPKSFLIEQVEKLKVARNSGFRFPSVFDDETSHQYLECLILSRRDILHGNSTVQHWKPLGLKNTTNIRTDPSLIRLTRRHFYEKRKMEFPKFQQLTDNRRTLFFHL